MNPLIGISVCSKAWARRDLCDWPLKTGPAKSFRKLLFRRISFHSQRAEQYAWEPASTLVQLNNHCLKWTKQSFK